LWITSLRKDAKWIAALLVLTFLAALAIEFWIHYMLQEMTPKNPAELAAWSAGTILITVLLVVLFWMHWKDLVCTLLHGTRKTGIGD
jgi:ABC-type maltose transport system permease subunit